MTVDLSKMTYDQKNEYLRGRDLVEPKKETYASFDLKNIDDMSIVKDITKASLEAMKIKTDLHKNSVQLDKYIVVSRVDEEKYKEAKDLFNKEMQKRFDEWQNHLIAFYGLIEPVHNVIYSKAYEDGHYAGYSEVESIYSGLVDFAEAIMKATEKTV